MLTSQQQRAACWNMHRWRLRDPACHLHSRTISQAKSVSRQIHLSKEALSFLSSIKHEANFLLPTETDKKGLYNQFTETEVQSGKLSKRQVKIVERNLLREEKLKESLSYEEAPKKYEMKDKDECEDNKML